MEAASKIVVTAVFRQPRFLYETFSSRSSVRCQNVVDLSVTCGYNRQHVKNQVPHGPAPVSAERWRSGVGCISV